ncbi:MAG: MFS transporter, partial [Thiothrix sp.]
MSSLTLLTTFLPSTLNSSCFFLLIIGFFFAVFLAGIYFLFILLILSYLYHKYRGIDTITIMNNVVTAYILSFLWRSWFWLGIWIFYYLKYTDYAGIGFLEAVMITTATIGEIPTGAIADIVGKKKAVIAAFIISGLGNLTMAFASSYTVLLGSIIMMTLGGCFYSGSLEALVYDGLKNDGKEKIFNKVISRMNTMQNLGMAMSGAVGGYLYTINNSLPFIMVAIFYAIGAI